MAAARALATATDRQRASPRCRRRTSASARSAVTRLRDALNAIRERSKSLGGPVPAEPHACAALRHAHVHRRASNRCARTRLRISDGRPRHLRVAAVSGGGAAVTSLHVASLAREGYYNSLTFHRVVPNFVIQGGSPGANEYSGQGPFMRDEVGLLSHRRGTLGISTRGRDTGDAQIFINLVDLPRLDHTYTVFAEVVCGHGRRRCDYRRRCHRARRSADAGILNARPSDIIGIDAVKPAATRPARSTRRHARSSRCVLAASTSSTSRSPIPHASGSTTPRICSPRWRRRERSSTTRIRLASPPRGRPSRTTSRVAASRCRRTASP